MTGNEAGITLLGLGPGNPIHLTREAWEFLQEIPEIYLRTREHPAVAIFPAELQVHTFDHLYETADHFDELYQAIIDRILALGSRPGGVVYAVPGHPFIAEATGPEIFRRAGELGLPVRIVEGMSFLEPTLSALGLDPLPQLTLVDALELAADYHPSFPPDRPAIIAQIHSLAIAAEIKLTLMAAYPDDHPVRLVHAAGLPQSQVESLPLYRIDRSDKIGLLTTLFVPALAPATSFEAFQEIIARLRAPEGCPWDREQTHLTLRPYLLEEAYETLSALDAEDPEALREELGDLLIQVVLHTQIATEEGEFTMADVLQHVQEKLVRRHPHVFGDVQLEGVEGVKENWERLKAMERASKGESQTSLLEGVSPTLPALSQAAAYQNRAARVGFDWPQIAGVIAKVEEELAEVQAAPDGDARGNEIGDLLFAVVNLARWCGVDAESMLREANVRFRGRFSRLEDAARAGGRSLSDLSLTEMEALWQAVKGQ